MQVALLTALIPTVFALESIVSDANTPSNRSEPVFDADFSTNAAQSLPHGMLIKETVQPYQESLDFTPLPRHHLLSSFSFSMESESDTHFSVFPKTLVPILQKTQTRDLHLRFTHGYWDSQEWGLLPHNGSQSGSSGVELWAAIEADSQEEAFENWVSLANSLSGLFCASLNFIDAAHTTFPIHSFRPDYAVPVSQGNLYLLRAVLANEPVCTENLTPFVKLLPTKGKAGVAGLLDGHRVFDSVWQSMSIDITAGSSFKLDMHVDIVLNVPNSLLRMESPIPKPSSENQMRCDMDKPFDAFQCFPLPESPSTSYEISKLFGKALETCHLTTSHVCAHVGQSWKVYIKVDDDYFATADNCFELKSSSKHDIYFETEDSASIVGKNVPLYVTRSFTGSADNMGFRTVFKNPHKHSVELVYFEALPWFVRPYLSSLSIDGFKVNDIIKETFYSPAIDRKRPTHIEYKMVIPPETTLAMSYQFDKSLLQYSEYPPDANHGFDIEPAVVFTEGYVQRTQPLLLLLATPDFSMPYNVIILTSTIMGIAFGTLFNMLTKKLITVEQADKLRSQTLLARLKAKLGR